jgi:hypothetical protein
MRRFVDTETGEIITLPKYMPYPDSPDRPGLDPNSALRRLLTRPVAIRPVPVVRYRRVRRTKPMWPTVVRHVSPILTWGAIAIGLMLCSR